MGARIDRLLSIAGPALGPAIQAVPGAPEGRLGIELSEFLARANGFYAFEAALHVLPVGPTQAGPMTVQFWNDEHLWRAGYGELAQGLFFFAEDIFGGQFALRGEHVVTFEPETGSVDVLATSLEAWADCLLKDYPLLTGFPLAHRWQQAHGQLAAGRRLLPKRPFVLGGEYRAENLYDLDAVEGMQFRADLAMQLKNLPDGARVNVKIVE